MLFCFKQKVSNIKICTSLSYIKLWMREKQQLVREGSVLILTFTFVLKPHYLLFFPRRLSEHTISLKLLRSSHYLICAGKIKQEDCLKKKKISWMERKVCVTKRWTLSARIWLKHWKMDFMESVFKRTKEKQTEKLSLMLWCHSVQLCPFRTNWGFFLQSLSVKRI